MVLFFYCTRLVSNIVTSSLGILKMEKNNHYDLLQIKNAPLWSWAWWEKKYLEKTRERNLSKNTNKKYALRQDFSSLVLMPFGAV